MLLLSLFYFQSKILKLFFHPVLSCFFIFSNLFGTNLGINFIALTKSYKILFQLFKKNCLEHTITNKNLVMLRWTISIHYENLLFKGSSLVTHWLSVPEHKVQIRVKDKFFPLSFLSFVLMIAVYLKINSRLCKVIDSWINSSCLAFNIIEKYNSQT